MKPLPKRNRRERRRTIFVPLGVFATMVTAADPAGAAVIGSVDYASNAVSGGDVIINTSGAAKLRITVAYPDVARVWVSPNGVFTKDPSYAVNDESWSSVPFTVNDKGAYLQILTSGMSIRINKQPLGAVATVLPDAGASPGTGTAEAGAQLGGGSGQIQHQLQRDVGHSCVANAQADAVIRTTGSEP